MKTKIEILLVLTLLLGGRAARCQTNTPSQVAAPTQTFFQTAAHYFTSVNTNYTWAGNTFEFAVGADYMSSVNWANYLDAQYDFSGTGVSPVTSNFSGTSVSPVSSIFSGTSVSPVSSFASRLALEAKIRNAGIAGTVDSAEAGLQLTLVSHYSVKLQAGLDAGYDLDRGCGLLEPKLTLRDKLTPNTFAGVVLSLPVWLNGKPLNRLPDLGLEAGFTY